MQQGTSVLAPAGDLYITFVMHGQDRNGGDTITYVVGEQC